MLTVASIERSCAFYRSVLGMEVKSEAGRTSLHFGNQKINLHEVGHELSPRAHRATAGSGDLCFIAATPLEEVIAELGRFGVAIELGPVERAGATSRIRSVYFRDPDANLIEVSNPA